MAMILLAIIKCQAHRKGYMHVTKGNNAIDEAAKVAADSKKAVFNYSPISYSSTPGYDKWHNGYSGEGGPNEKNLCEECGANRTPMVCASPTMVS